MASVWLNALSRELKAWAGGHAGLREGWGDQGKQDQVAAVSVCWPGGATSTSACPGRHTDLEARPRHQSLPHNPPPPAPLRPRPP